MLIYLARPMGSYILRGQDLLPDPLYRKFLSDRIAIIDPALCNKVSTVKGMDPWVRLVQSCDTLIAITSDNIVTAGVYAEIAAANDAGIEVITPYLTAPPTILTIEQSVTYNSLGVAITERPYPGFRLAGDPRCPGYVIRAEDLIHAHCKI